MNNDWPPSPLEHLTSLVAQASVGDNEEVLEEAQGLYDAIFAEGRKSVEKDALALAGKWNEEQKKYPKTSSGSNAAAAVRLCAKELREVVKENDDG